MSYKLFLDDIRTPPSSDWTIARSVKEAIDIINNLGFPNTISFDNDLGENELEGYDFAKWIVEQDLNNKITLPDNFCFFVHSANPVASISIKKLLLNYLNFKKQQ